MKIEIEIPTAFEQDFAVDRFAEFFDRVLADMGCVCGRYEEETAEMFKKAFQKAKLVGSMDKGDFEDTERER